jgi:autotransporter-associated beta strand protein
MRLVPKKTTGPIIAAVLALAPTSITLGNSQRHWSGNGTLWTSTTDWVGGVLPAVGDDAIVEQGPLVQNQSLGLALWNIETLEIGSINDLTISGTQLGFTLPGSPFFTPGIILESSFGHGTASGIALMTMGVIPLQTNVTFNVIARPDGARNVLEIDSEIEQSSGTDSVTITGAGIVYLENTSNSYAGGTNVTGNAILQINSDGSLGSGGNVNINNSTLRFQTGVTITSGRSYALTGSVGIDTQSSSGTINGTISGIGATLTKNGTGTLTLTNNNTYSGGTTIDAGTLVISNANGTGTGGVSVLAGATLDLDAQSVSTHNLVLNDSGVGSGGALINSSATAASWSGNISLASNTTIGGTGNITLSGLVTENVGPFALIKVGTNKLTLTGATNSWSGGTFVQAGILTIGNAGALPNATTVTLGNGTTSASLDLAGSNITVAGLATAGTGTSNTVGSSSTIANSTLTFAGGTSTFAATIQDALGIGNQTVALAISSGNLSLSGNNTYSGGTVVNGGTLSITNTSGSATGTGNVTLNGGTLIGTGAISGSVLAGTGAHTINPGDVGTTGNLTVGGLSTNANTTLAFDLDSPSGTNDLLNVAGNITLSNGTLAITSQATHGAASLGYYPVIAYSGTLTGTRDGIALPTITSNVSYTLETTKTAGVIYVHRGFVGDADDSGTVDLTDLNTVLNNLGTTTTLWTMGNFAGDPTIDLSDLNDVLNNLGTSIPSGAAVVAGSFQGKGVSQRIYELQELVWTLQDPLTSDEITEIQDYADSLGLFARITPDDPSAEPALAADFQGIPDFQPVPEPCSLALLAPLGGLLLKRRRQRSM